MYTYPYIYSRFSVVVKECDEIRHLWRNKCFEFISIWKSLNVMEDKSCRRYILSKKDNSLFKSDNYDMKIFDLFSVLELQGGYSRLKITINTYNMRGAWMDKSGYNCPSWDFTIMSVYNLVGLGCHGIFYTCVISQCHQQWVSKGKRRSDNSKKRKCDQDLGQRIMQN